MMKVFAATLAVLLLVAICSSVDASSQKQDIPTVCCFTYISRRIPRRMISSAYRTSEICPQPGVILVTVKGRNVCANPAQSWVQTYLKDFETLKS